MAQQLDRRTFLTGVAFAGVHGGLLAAGRGFAAGGQRGSVGENHVWTPGRGAQDLVTQTSVDALPLNSWVKVAGTQLSTLTDALAERGWRIGKSDWSNGKNIRSTLTPWVGCARDGMRVYYPRGGGHADSSVNGTWIFDLTTMRWDIADMPSDPAAPGKEWDPVYRKPPTYTRYTGQLPTDDGLYTDMLPDGRPTSAHTYGGVWFDSKRRCVGTGRVSKWTLDLAMKKWTRARWTWEGGPPTFFSIQQQLHYHAGNDAIYGFPARKDIDYYGFGKCPAAGADWQALRAPPNWAKTDGSSCRLDADKVLFFWHHGKVDRWGIFDMAKEAWAPGSGTAIGNEEEYRAPSEMKPAIWVPAWGQHGQVIRRSAGGSQQETWWLFDLATKSNQAYQPQGARPEKYSRFPGNKWMGIDEAGLCMMLDDNGPVDQPAVLVMRYR
ncbi:hypothetical protein [Pseudorhodoferax sp.]|uniref:hypothetical protein n=1 Tax=Pseudorhodoferax sp. TaxID=1993553 RepID=UPI002DD66DA2|nr:hypothetical protein [Pseudorhodoferax sp.]